MFAACAGRAPTDAEAEATSAAGSRWALARLWRGGWGQAEARLARVEPPVFPAPPASSLPLPLRALDALAADDWARMMAGQPPRPVASASRQWIMARAALRRA